MCILFLDFHVGTSVFEERRRKGLSRFINTVVQHPTIGCDEVVVAFLSHSSVSSLPLSFVIEKKLYVWL